MPIELRTSATAHHAKLEGQQLPHVTAVQPGVAQAKVIVSKVRANSNCATNTTTLMMSNVTVTERQGFSP